MNAASTRRTSAPVLPARRVTSRRLLPWLLLGMLVVAQIGYPLTAGASRARLTIATVVCGYLLSISHALLTRGYRTASALALLVTGGGWAVEAVGVSTGFPFGGYHYSGQLGPKLFGVPLVIPLAWAWMAWPAWLAAVRLTGPGPRRVALAAVGLAAWDLFLDPQMVAEGYWSWRGAGSPTLPGLDDIPVSNYVGWLLFAVLVMALLRPLAGPAVHTSRGGDDGVLGGDTIMYALYLWTYLASALAHAVFLNLPASAAWGTAIMGVTAGPLLVTLIRQRWRTRAGTT